MERFKAGQRVRIIANNVYSREFDRFIGTEDVIDRFGFHSYYLVGRENDNTTWNHDELELIEEEAVKPVEPKVFSLKEAQKLCIDGAKVSIDDQRYLNSYMFFDGEDFMWYNDPDKSTEKAIGVFDYSKWRLYVEPPTPPKFQPKQLIANAQGDIGYIVEDKGIKKGVRVYSVKFSVAEKCPLKRYEESKLTAVEL